MAFKIKVNGADCTANVDVIVLRTPRPAASKAAFLRHCKPN